MTTRTEPTPPTADLAAARLNAHVAAQTDAVFFEHMVATRAEIVILEKYGYAVAARTLREQVLCELEAWLGPISTEVPHVS